MGNTAYPLFWAMQDLYHQQSELRFPHAGHYGHLRSDVRLLYRRQPRSAAANGQHRRLRYPLRFRV